MKLKTLKDLEQERKNTLTRQGLIEWVKSVSIKDLREEAIKWVKNCKVITGFSLECKDTNLEYKCLGCLRMMKFHNITEGDLKEKEKRIESPDYPESKEEWEECEDEINKLTKEEYLKSEEKGR